MLQRNYRTVFFWQQPQKFTRIEKHVFSTKTKLHIFVLSASTKKLSKQLNIVQIYIDQKAFIVERKDTDITKVVEIVNMLGKIKGGAVNKVMYSKLKDNFKDILQYLDSERDRMYWRLCHSTKYQILWRRFILFMPIVLQHM